MTKGYWIALWILVSFGLWCALFFGAIAIGLQFMHDMRRLGDAGAITVLLIASGLTLLAVGFAMNWARQWLSEARDAVIERAARYVVAGGAALLLAGAGATVAGVA